MKYLSFLVMAFFSFMPSFAQKSELGKVTVEELKEKSCPSDSTATAAVLFEKGRTFFEYRQGEGFDVVTEVDIKIKIYSKEGYNWANKTVAFYVGNSPKEEVTFEKAVTYNLVDGQIQKSKLKNEGEFVEKKNKFWSEHKITMPNVREGSIVEYRYIIRSPYISSFPEWSFQKSIPVNYSEYTTSIPEYFVYNIYRKGFLQPKENIEKKHKTIVHNNKVSSNPREAYDTKTVTKSISYSETVTTYKLDNIPALRDEMYVNNIRNYSTIFQHELSVKKMSELNPEYFSETWEDVVKKIYETDGFGNELSKVNYFENDINSIVKDSKTAIEKVNAVYDFIKTRMNWDGTYGYLCDKGVRKAFDDKIGNVAEINLMLTAMLRNAGVEANPVLVSTRSNGINLFPSRNAYNYIITAVEIDNNVLLLDATNKYALPNIMPIRNLNWFGRLIRNNGSSSEIDLMAKTISKNHINLMANIDQNGGVSGKIKEVYTDYESFVFRDANNSLSKDSYLERLEKQRSGIEVEEYTVENEKELDKILMESYSFKHNNSVEVIDGKMYFSPLLFLSVTENPFKEETRSYPIDFVYPNQYKKLLTLTIPEGYTVESVPAPINVVFSENLMSYKFNIVAKGNQLQIISVMDVNTSILPAEDYEELKVFFSEMVKKQKEKIVLKKA
ncbi:DUF3857 domain-containing protein [Flavobacterium enshiense]|uniref:DUF3857 domain-containing protein n=1 Tax=Flavobacterium enshiense TaxID=1341165 RepID=UPI00345CE488